jgi:hypothetical protein
LHINNVTQKQTSCLVLCKRDEIGPVLNSL